MQYKNLILDDDDFLRLEEIYKLFGSTPRLKILVRLSKGECGVTELCDVAGLTQSATSHQLKDLKQCRIVKSRREGLNVFYALDDDHIVKILESGIEHVKGDHCEDCTKCTDQNRCEYCAEDGRTPEDEEEE